MADEAAQLYQKLVKEFGMPECPTLMNMGHVWYETPEELGGDPDSPISTAVFRPLSNQAAAQKMADHASSWLASFVRNEPSAPATEPVARLQQIIKLAGSRRR
ncbi:MAG: hypothetical protein M5U25_18290 [Planctomycetota bacterium]|nr:hypothetical protein [Planctomycetota bacterium]